MHAQSTVSEFLCHHNTKNSGPSLENVFFVISTNLILEIKHLLKKKSLEKHGNGLFKAFVW